MRKYHCKVCKDTGETGQAEMLDCTAPGCNAAQERHELTLFVISEKKTKCEYDLVWAIHQRATKLAEQNELTHIGCTPVYQD